MVLYSCFTLQDLDKCFAVSVCELVKALQPCAERVPDALGFCAAVAPGCGLSPGPWAQPGGRGLSPGPWALGWGVTLCSPGRPRTVRTPGPATDGNEEHALTKNVATGCLLLQLDLLYGFSLGHIFFSPQTNLSPSYLSFFYL